MGGAVEFSFQLMFHQLLCEGFAWQQDVPQAAWLNHPLFVHLNTPKGWAGGKESHSVAGGTGGGRLWELLVVSLGSMGHL